MTKGAKIGSFAIAGLLFVLLVLFSAGVLIRQRQGNYENPFDPRGDAHWKLSFMQRMAADDTYEFDTHDPHPTRGWTPKPSLRIDGPEPLTINANGFRSRGEYAFQPDKYRVMVVGESFTYGLEVGDGVEWPAVLQELDDRMQVVNLAVPGYGTDQILITLRESINEYRPHLVIMALTHDDFSRSLLTFREYKKPRFMMDGTGTLTLTNTPVGGLEETYQSLLSEYGGPGNEKLAAEDAALRARLKSGEYYREWEALNRRLLGEAVLCCRGHGAELLLVYLTAAYDVAGEGDEKLKPTPVETAMMDTAESGEGTAYCDTRRPFVEAGGPWVRGHYKAREHQLAASVIYKAVQERGSWKKAFPPPG